jgi:hypothetical protein
MLEHWKHLYAVPISELELSEKTLHSLYRHGVTSVGDCLDHFLRIGNAGFLARGGFVNFMHAEVLDKLVERGYMTPEKAEKFRQYAD